MAPTMNVLLEAPSHDEIYAPPRHQHAGLLNIIHDPNTPQPQQPPVKTIDPDHPALHGSLTPPLTCPTSKLLNFSPGPTNLPPAVESEIQRRCFPPPSERRLGSMALSHRSPEFGSILNDALDKTRRVMQIPPEYDILFAQGGGHGQFAAVPMNLCPTGTEVASYVVNGTWSKRAVDEASKYCRPHVISSVEDDGSCAAYPSADRIKGEVDPSSAFLYVCSNETVNGLELHRLLPKLASNVPLVVDASSDFTSKTIGWRESNVGVLFACASKNIGHPGVTLVVVRKDLLGRANPFTPGFLNYETNILADNVWNTIPTFNVDVVGIMMGWILDNGGVDAMERMSVAKSERMYDAIDDSGGFYVTPVNRESGYRSRMNVPFRVADGDEALTDLFLVECWERGIVGLRTITPFGKSMNLRASLYHGVSYEEVMVLTGFMREFAARHSVPKAQAEVPEGIGASMINKGMGMNKGVIAEHGSPPLFDGSPESSSDNLFELSMSPMGCMDLCVVRFDKELGMLHNAIKPKAPYNVHYNVPLGSSPDNVADPSFTLPKNFKVNQYARVSDDMFVRPVGRDSPPPSLR
eukprot:CAMPEP_0181081074 /NCGR_PEP_ID=MMETSP1071-20121207/2911_1 /TAXON_ID=35127 /ORGANISM="Thalassiosira sp., Strain NH16" /LENGTH=579 /DNA_ID=CAMNT_0023162603 /DNA_START=142 /DNA_END=1881 /DNA_ORIENTATION=+